MKSSLVVATMVMALAACQAQDTLPVLDPALADAPTGDPLLDLIESLAPAEFTQIFADATSDGTALSDYLEAQPPATLIALSNALSPYGIDANAPTPAIETLVDNLSPASTVKLVDDVLTILAANAPNNLVLTDDIIPGYEESVINAGRKLKL
jgi:hypothetical protein